MYYSTATGYIIILSPLILLALLATIGIVLYRHPSKLQRKWYSVSFKKRKRIKQIAILLGFCMAAGLFIYPLTSKKQFVSTISLSANENNFITENKINQISEDRREIKNEQWLKKFYKMMKSDDESSTLLDDSGSYEVWKTSIMEDKTGEYELRLRAEDTVLHRLSIQQPMKILILTEISTVMIPTDFIISFKDQTIHLKKIIKSLQIQKNKKFRISIGITKTVFCMQQMKIIRDVSMEHPSII